jgi:hypothetical protein
MRPSSAELGVGLFERNRVADLYRAYGKAALYAAGLENKLVLALALKRSAGLGDDAFLKEYAKLEKKTLGPLISESKASALFNEDSEENLRLVLQHRNWMVHNIARDVLGFVVQKDGESILEHNLLEIANFFQGVSELIYQEIIKLAEARGIPETLINELVAGAFSADIEPNKPLNSTPESDVALRGHSRGGAS